VLGTSLPALLGYDPSSDVTSAEAQTGLMLVYGGLPALLMCVGVLFLRNFPVTRERHAEVRAAIAARTAGTSR
jgi:Na+/melibiose symporter-like transporter